MNDLGRPCGAVLIRDKGMRVVVPIKHGKYSVSVSDRYSFNAALDCRALRSRFALTSTISMFTIGATIWKGSPTDFKFCDQHPRLIRIIVILCGYLTIILETSSDRTFRMPVTKLNGCLRPDSSNCPYLCKILIATHKTWVEAQNLQLVKKGSQESGYRAWVKFCIRQLGRTRRRS